MLFSSITFLYCFLPCVLLVYFVVPDRLKNFTLLAASLIFYGWGEPKYLVFMLLSVTQSYIAALLVERFRGKKLAKLALALSAVASLGLLAYCKYADFFIENFNAVTGLSVPLLKVALPVGISFYTFQILSYVVDVYRGDVPAQRNFIDLAMYIAMFPQLIAGPIVRYSDIAGSLKNRKTTLADASEGIRRFSIGLAKKILLANSAALLVSEFKAYNEKTVLFYWLYALAYMLHIYFDFSGYSDMAIGLGRIFGFRFSENFNYPYISASITEFWRRWHISLGGWFRDYLYIPLGGNRVKPFRHVINILVVWAATGLWHGASWNFVLWGLLYAALLLFEKYVLHPKIRFAVPMHIYTLLFVMLGFILFDSASVADALTSFKALFGFGGIPAANTASLYYLKSNIVLLVVAVIGATPLPKLLYEKIGLRKLGGKILAVVTPLATLASVAICTAYLIDGSFNPFVYFRF
mgnify:CR=1 FL=1